MKAKNSFIQLQSIVLISILLGFSLVKCEEAQARTKVQNSVLTSSNTQQCINLSFSKCTVCFDKQQDDYAFSSCSQQVCKNYKKVLWGATTNECLEWKTQTFSNSDCERKCCAGDSTFEFSYRNINLCKDHIDDVGMSTSTIIAVTVGILAFIFLMCCICTLRNEVLRERLAQYCCFSCLKRGSIDDANQSPHRRGQNIKGRSFSNLVHGYALTGKGSQLEWEIKNEEVNPQHKEVSIMAIVINTKMNKQQEKQQIETNNKEDNSCAICLNDKTNCVTNCGHYFHTQCFSMWLKKNITCPMCIQRKFNPLRVTCYTCWNKQADLYLNGKSQEANYTRILQCKDCFQGEYKKTEPKIEPIQCVSLTQLMETNKNNNPGK